MLAPSSHLAFVDKWKLSFPVHKDFIKASNLKRIFRICCKVTIQKINQLNVEASNLCCHIWEATYDFSNQNWGKGYRQSLIHNFFPTGQAARSLRKTFGVYISIPLTCFQADHIRVFHQCVQLWKPIFIRLNYWACTMKTSFEIAMQLVLFIILPHKTIPR